MPHKPPPCRARGYLVTFRRLDRGNGDWRSPLLVRLTERGIQEGKRISVNGFRDAKV